MIGCAGADFGFIAETISFGSLFHFLAGFRRAGDERQREASAAMKLIPPNMRSRIGMRTSLSASG